MDLAAWLQDDSFDHCLDGCTNVECLCFLKQDVQYNVIKVQCNKYKLQKFWKSVKMVENYAIPLFVDN